MIRKTLEHCEDGKLYVAINLAFACSMRVGEILGLTWDNVYISDSDIETDNAYVYIDEEYPDHLKERLKHLMEKTSIISLNH